MGFLNFEEQLVFYGQYHTNTINVIIHIVCVPIILWATLMCLAKIPIIVFFDVFPFNVSFAITFSLVFYYILMEPVAGAALSPILLTMNYTANVLVYRSKHSSLIVLSLLTVAWTLQLAGHAFFERRSPAFFEHIKSFILAPLFVFMELLFALGYRPALNKRISDKVKASVITWKHGKRVEAKKD